MTAPNVTDHAHDRGHTRLGLRGDALERLASKALVEGRRPADFSGSFKRFLDGLYLSHENSTNTRVYGGHVYIFAGSTLITVIHVPPKFRKAASRGA